MPFTWRCFNIWVVLVCLIGFPFMSAFKITGARVPHRTEPLETTHRIDVVIRTDRLKYSLDDTVKLDVSLQNNIGPTIYVDRRMYWGGYGGGLKLVISDESGKPISGQFGDAIMPPPKEGDPSILIRLDQGFFYGTGLDLPARDSFPRAGKYSIRVVYKSWLRRDFVAPQFQKLPVLWDDTPDFPSNLIWIEVE